MLLILCCVAPVARCFMALPKQRHSLLCLAMDFVFCLGAVGFIRLATLHLKSKAHHLPAYPGPFMVADGDGRIVQSMPPGLSPWYFYFGFASSFIVPLIVSIIHACKFGDILAFEYFGGYLIVFAFQAWYEDVCFRSNLLMAPAFPIAIWQYRTWQMIRALWTYKTTGANTMLLFYTIVYELFYCALDLGALMVLLPLTFNYSLTENKNV